MSIQNQKLNDDVIQEKQYNYFYKTTNLLNGKFYYGIHSTDRLNDGYLGSGNALKKAIKKYGKINFSFEIILNFSTRKEVVEHESCVVTDELINDDMCYNLKLGGLCGNLLSEETKNKMRLARTGKIHSEEAKQKCRNSHLGKRKSDAHKLNLSKSKKGKPWTEKQWEILGTSSDITKEKIRNANLGKTIPLEQIERMVLKLRGQRRSNESKKLMSQSCKTKIAVIVDEILFESITSCAIHYNITHSMATHRLQSKNYPNWKYES